MNLQFPPKDKRVYSFPDLITGAGCRIGRTLQEQKLAVDFKMSR